MTPRSKTTLKIVDDADLTAAEATFAEATKQSAPMVQRLASHRDGMAQAVKELESERFDLISRRDLLRRQFEAVEQGLTVHIDDVEATLRLYEAGLNSLAATE